MANPAFGQPGATDIFGGGGAAAFGGGAAVGTTAAAAPDLLGFAPAASVGDGGAAPTKADAVVAPQLQRWKWRSRGEATEPTMLMVYHEIYKRTVAVAKVCTLLLNIILSSSTSEIANKISTRQTVRALCLSFQTTSGEGIEGRDMAL
jgi:hypothetical protein